MKIYKQKTTEAIEEFIDVKYLLPPDKLKFNDIDCSLCLVYCRKNGSCDGCLNMVFFDKGSNMTGCGKSKTFFALISHTFTMHRNKRRKFWQIVLPKLKDIPAKYFTPSGFQKKPFKFMIDIDTELYEM